MAKNSNNEKYTDFLVYELAKDAQINLEYQGSQILEIKNALKTASKNGKGNYGKPDFVAIVKDFLIVIENKKSMDLHEKIEKDKTISEDSKSIIDYAVNGALFYGKHLSKNTNYKKIIVLGVSGDKHKHRISPVFIDGNGNYKILSDVETLIPFNQDNIDKYYKKYILEENIDLEKSIQEILKNASELHEDLKNYGAIKNDEKPLIVSGILLALDEIKKSNFNIENLIGDDFKTDGQKIYGAIKDNLDRLNIFPTVKKDKLLNQFSIIKDSTKINQVNSSLGKTPLKHFTEFLYKKIYHNISYNNNSEDFLGKFYGQFMSYNGGDGKSLGIILTPRHITELFCDLLDLKLEDKVIDPCCGTGGFLITAMQKMLAMANTQHEKNNIKTNHLFGIEEQSYMFTIAITNLILRDGKTNIENSDFLSLNPAEIQKKGCTVGMMNPPYSQGSKQKMDLYELAFTEHLLDSIVKGGKVAVIVPQSSMTGKTKEEQNIKNSILKKHTLEGVITLNKNTFYGVSVIPCIAIFTAGIPHQKDKISKFINFENDGYKLTKNVGLIPTQLAHEKKQFLLDVWFNRINCSNTKFCINTTIEANDEWLRSFYYSNDEIPKKRDFKKTVAEYMSFKVNMIVKGKGYLFKNEKRQ